MHGLQRLVPPLTGAFGLLYQGRAFVACTVGAYWLIDEIAFAQSRLKLARENFQRWALVVDYDRRGLLPSR